MFKNVSIIEFPTNLGLKEPCPGKEPGVNRLPLWLRKYHFHSLVAATDIKTLQSPAYRMGKDPEQSVLNTDLIRHYAEAQADLLVEALSRKEFLLVLGGDCSIVVGIALAMKRAGEYAMFYLDGHTDFVEPALSETKAVAGMASAIVTGRGHQKLTNINNMGPYIREENLWCVGNREYDYEYENVVTSSRATYVNLNMLREKGISQVADSFLKFVNNQQLKGFWLHIDVDVLNDNIMPAVDSRTPDGLTYAEFKEMAGLLLASQSLAGLDITILDPDRDPEGKYTKEFVSNFTEMFNKAGDNSL